MKINITENKKKISKSEIKLKNGIFELNKKQISKGNTISIQLEDNLINIKL
jgi:hypothetical protein